MFDRLLLFTSLLGLGITVAQAQPSPARPTPEACQVNSAEALPELEKRRQTQPIGEWSCGSVFTNPPGDHAARLIETAGLKGYRVGDASVSTKHANFIINHGQASAAQIEQLIEHVRTTVQIRHNVRLHPEVRILGEKA